MRTEIIAPPSSFGGQPRSPVIETFMSWPVLGFGNRKPRAVDRRDKFGTDGNQRMGGRGRGWREDKVAEGSDAEGQRPTGQRWAGRGLTARTMESMTRREDQRDLFIIRRVERAKEHTRGIRWPKDGPVCEEAGRKRSCRREAVRDRGWKTKTVIIASTTRIQCIGSSQRARRDAGRG